MQMPAEFLDFFLILVYSKYMMEVLKISKQILENSLKRLK